MRNLISLGLHLGSFPGDGGDWVHEIRHGGEIELLTQFEFMVWMVPGLDADELDNIRTGLIDRGLLTEISEEMARSHRLSPLLMGLGPSQGSPGLFAVGLPGRELLAISPETFEVWAASALCSTIWDACGGSEDALDAVLDDLPRLIANGGGYLERVQA